MVQAQLYFLKFLRRAAPSFIGVLLSAGAGYLLSRLILGTPIGFYALRIFAPLPILLWLALGLLVAYGCWKIAGHLNARNRAIWTISFLFFYLLTPWAEKAYGNYIAQKNARIAKVCRDVETFPVKKGPVSEPVRVEGYLDRTDYDNLLNARFQRNADAIDSGSGGSHVYDTGDYVSHPVFDTFQGTFAEHAYHVLTQKRFSYIEFEMAPNKNGEYSNTSGMKTDGWSGTRYRLFYLAPISSLACAEKVIGRSHSPGGIPTVSIQVPTRPKPDDPFCLVMEIADRPISKYALIADESVEDIGGEAKLYGFTVPLWIRVRLDRIRMIETDSQKVLSSYAGFNYPDELSTRASKKAVIRYKCNKPDAGMLVLDATIAPSVERKFLSSKAWYEGSVVQELYESPLPSK